MSLYKRKSKRPRAAQPETAKTREHKVRRLAEMTAALREGTEQHFEVTRLTSVTVAQSEPKSFWSAQNSNFDKRIN